MNFLQKSLIHSIDLAFQLGRCDLQLIDGNDMQIYVLIIEIISLVII